MARRKNNNKTSPAKTKKIKPFDGRRGYYGDNGWWVSLEEAQKTAKGQQWWTRKLDGKSVPIPSDNDTPVWQYFDGDMYLGGWDEDTHEYPVQDGFGVYFDTKGCVHLLHTSQRSESKNSKENMVYWSKGITYWLDSSKAWETNRAPGSEIQQVINGKKVGIPFIYEGEYIDYAGNDPNAIVTLKDGTTRRGPWKDSLPVGDWWSQHELISPGIPMLQKQQTTERQERAARRKRKQPDPTPAVPSGHKQPPRRCRQLGFPLRNANLLQQAVAADDTVVAAAPDEKTGNQDSTIPTANMPVGSRPRKKQHRQTKNNSSSSPSDEKAHSQDSATGTATATATGTATATATATGTGTGTTDTNIPVPSKPRRKQCRTRRSHLVKNESEEEEGPVSCRREGQRVEDERKNQLAELAAWLANTVIGGSKNFTKLQMELYATELLKLGLYEPEIIRKLCNNEDISSWEWMLPFHRRALSAWLQGHQEQDNFWV